MSPCNLIGATSYAVLRIDLQTFFIKDGNYLY